MQLFRSEPVLWNWRVFGNIFDRKYRCLARLGGIQKALSVWDSLYLCELERKIRGELHVALAQEEMLWRQKARINWLTQEEWCTRFFHMSVISRRRQNTVTQLKDSLGNWCDDPIQLKTMARDYFLHLYTGEQCQTPTVDTWEFL